MQTTQNRWAWGWGWLLVVVAAGVFLRWAALSCYHDSIDSKGPGGAITWVITAVIYGLGYAFLLPAYLWLISPRPWWGLALIVPPIALSFGILYRYTEAGLAGGNRDSYYRHASWDHWQTWPYYEVAYGPWHLLLSIGLTLALVGLGIGLRLWLRRWQPVEE